MRSPDASAQRSSVSVLIGLTVALLVVRLWLDAHLELMFDEAYYTLWAKHLAWCYLDHPPLVALWIRLSTWCFGGNAFGVRALGTLAAAAGTGVVYLLSWHLFANRAAATFAGLLYCSMLLIAAGAIIVTPDTPLVFFWSIALYALAQIYRGTDARWWLVVGIAMGLALQSKYTALLLGAGIPCAMITVPRMRVWWRRPEPYLAGILAFAIFLPVVVWNYRHGWASFAKQFSRADVDGLGIRYVAELAASQIGLLTPLVFVLAAAGCWLALSRRDNEDRDAELFLVSLIAPMMLYFLFAQPSRESARQLDRARVSRTCRSRRPSRVSCIRVRRTDAIDDRLLPQVGRADRCWNRRVCILASHRCPAAARCGQGPDLVDGGMVALGAGGRRRRSAGRSLLHTHVELCAHKRARRALGRRDSHTPV